jgi:hypothetical protein
MPENPVQQWERLQCQACQGEEFLQRSYLKVRAGAGTSTEPSGWQCAQCHQDADIRLMQQQLHYHQRHAELVALERELQDTNPAARPARSILNGS